ncbi:LacI family DNA-binding transcriptional regulator [Pseudolysinimonas sp.]|uniref:LacI family DNA-binding transcriptional regulator n=1 Tax=Pseudolysinimonas sp. TaxID=2680009 RepID=UPI003F81D70B
MATIYEVAAMAGVSPATVSRVFNGQRVSPERVKAVREAADALAFTPNRVARTLRRQNSEVVALVIPDIENPFFTALARGVEDVAQAAGFSVVLCNSDGDHAKEERYLDISLSENMAGVIIAAADDHTHVRRLLDRGRPVVAVDRGPADAQVDTVRVDNRGGGAAATRELLARGYRRIACITGPEHVETAIERRAGWAQAMAGTDLDLDAYSRWSDFRVAGGRAAMTELLELPEPPDAVFVANNLMSVGALQVLVEQRRLPPEIGLASFGDLPFSTFAVTDMTVVHLPARNLGMTAARMLLDRISGDTEPVRTVVLSNSLTSP